MEKVSLDISREEGTVGNCQNFSGFVRQVPQRLKKKMMRKMHGMESQRRLNLFRPVTILILTLLFHLKLSYLLG